MQVKIWRFCRFFDYFMLIYVD